MLAALLHEGPFSFEEGVPRFTWISRVNCSFYREGTLVSVKDGDESRLPVRLVHVGAGRAIDGIGP